MCGVSIAVLSFGSVFKEFCPGRDTKQDPPTSTLSKHLIATCTTKRHYLKTALAILATQTSNTNPRGSPLREWVDKSQKKTEVTLYGCQEPPRPSVTFSSLIGWNVLTELKGQASLGDPVDPRQALPRPS